MQSDRHGTSWVLRFAKRTEFCFAASIQLENAKNLNLLPAGAEQPTAVIFLMPVKF